MAATQHIKRRITSVKNTRQITKAMEMVSASKLRRAHDAATRPRVYAETARSLLASLRQATGSRAHALFADRPVRARALVVIASDSGLVGAFNTNVLRRLIEELRADKQAGVSTKLILVGRRIARFAVRLPDVEILGVYEDVSDQPRPTELRALMSTVFTMFQSQTVDAVDVIYTHFHSTMRQSVKTMRVLPAGVAEEANVTPLIADFEPSAETLLEMTVARLVEAQIFQSMLESFASEHAMRMLAMKNATDNASELVDDLTLVYNNLRQASITQELAEITGGAEAMK